MLSNVLFPIETTFREKDYKLLMAAMVAKETGSAILAQHDLCEKIMGATTSGVYVGKNVMNKPDKVGDKYHQYRIAKKNHYSVVHIDEEGGIYRAGHGLWRTILNSRLDPNMLDEDDWLVTWGDFQYQHYQSMLTGSSSVPMSALGYPKFDFYKHHIKELIKRKQGSQVKKPYILINTHYTLANNCLGLDDTFSPRMDYGPSDEKKLSLIHDMQKESKSLLRVVELAHVLSAEFPDIDIVIRPHPSETNRFYEAATKSLRNVEVIYEKSVGECLVDALMLIHEKCTTSIEAFFLGVPVIQFNENPNKEDKMMQAMGVPCATCDDVVAAAKKIMSAEVTDTPIIFSDIDKSMIKNITETNIEAVIDGIVNKVKSKTKSPSYTPISFTRLWLWESQHALLAMLKKPIRYLFLKNKYRDYQGYKRSFDGFDKKEIQRDMDVISDMLSCSFKVQFVGRRLFSISRR